MRVPEKIENASIQQFMKMLREVRVNFHSKAKWQVTRSSDRKLEGRKVSKSQEHEIQDDKLEEMKNQEIMLQHHPR